MRTPLGTDSERGSPAEPSVHWYVEMVDSFERHALSAVLSNYQKRWAIIRLWSHFSGSRLVDFDASR